ncbi:NAD(P)/FAD-dependent oxidoreductase [Prauserella oleivorans]|uniref:NAD(P)/FAD-dependent oxidoreductase n=1 Tax=Prauserella oleivorans TaxID=1478153 RepID=A0ABW5W7B2_9PSEU
MPEPQRIVIVGAGLAGATAAATLRERGYAGEVVMLGSDRHPPYELPALSKALLLGDRDEPAWVRDAGFYADHDIQLYGGRTVTRLEPGARRVHDDHAGSHRYDRLLLATGSRPRQLHVPGGKLPGVHTLRTLDDALALRTALRDAERVVIVGAGWIGTEVAAAARKHGADVTVVDLVRLPLQGVLGDEVAAVFRDLHTEHGVRWRLGTRVAEITGTDRVRAVRLEDGTELPADVVVVAVGVEPRVDLAHTASLDPADDGGIVVDAMLRTSVPDIYAVGDIASHFHPRYGHRVRVEHWANAKDQGAHVAGNLLGADEPFLRSPYFFTDQYDGDRAIGCEYRGLADPVADKLVVRGDLDALEFVAFWLRNGRVRAAMNVNVWDYGEALDRIVDAQATLNEDALKGEDLNSLG